MIRIDIRPVWRFRSATEREFDFELITILAQIDATGKLTNAAEVAGRVAPIVRSRESANRVTRSLDFILTSSVFCKFRNRG